MINITSIIISAIVMTIVGFITAKIWGFDIPKVVSDIAAIVAILILTLPIPQGDIEELIQFLQNYIMTVFVSIIIPALIGDAIGTAVSKLIEEFGTIWQN